MPQGSPCSKRGNGGHRSPRLYRIQTHACTESERMVRAAVSHENKSGPAHGLSEAAALTVGFLRGAFSFQSWAALFKNDTQSF